MSLRADAVTAKFECTMEGGWSALIQRLLDNDYAPIVVISAGRASAIGNVLRRSPVEVRMDTDHRQTDSVLVPKEEEAVR